MTIMYTVQINEKKKKKKTKKDELSGLEYMNKTLLHSFPKKFPLNRVSQVLRRFKLVHVSWRLKCGKQ